MFENDPSAQGTATQDASQSQGNPASPGQETQQTTGVQKRIDELVAQRHQMEREFNAKFEAMQAQNAELLRTLAATAQSQRAPEPPPFEFEPEEKAKFDYIARQHMAPVQQYVAQLEAQLFGSQVHQAAARAGVSDPEVVAHAAKLAEGWARAGLMKSGVTTMDNAIDIALGMKARGELAKRGQNQQRSQMADFASPITQSAPPPAPTRAAEPELTYEQIEADPSAAAAALAKKLGLG
jgi:hypothetical protein